MEPSGQPAPAPSPSPAIRASDRDRDAIAQRLQEAFAERRLDDEEFDQRMRSALTARTNADLDRLVEDLPAAAAPGASHGRPAPAPGTVRDSAEELDQARRPLAGPRAPHVGGLQGRWLARPACG